LLENHIYGSDNTGAGTIAIIACSSYDNGLDGINIAGSNWDHPVQDVMINGTQIDNNRRFGLNSVYVKNFNMAGSIISANGIAIGQPVGNGTGLYMATCLEISISGTTFKGGKDSAAQFINCDAVSMAGCAISWNCNRSPTPYAIVISGGNQLTFGNLAFNGPTQPYAVWFGGIPQNLTMTGLSFSPNTTVRFANDGNIASATGSFQFSPRCPTIAPPPPSPVCPEARIYTLPLDPPPP
jgi:hypothetical protein